MSRVFLISLQYCEVSATLQEMSNMCSLKEDGNRNARSL